MSSPPGQVCLSHGCFSLLLPLGLAVMLQPRLTGCVSGAVLTHQLPVSSQVTQSFFDRLFQGRLCALLCWDLHASSPQALVHVVPDCEGHQGPKHPHGRGVTSPQLKPCREL